MSNHSALDQLAKKLGLQLNAPASTSALLEAESELGFELPPAVKQYFQQADGSQQNNNLRLLPVREAVDFAVQVPGFADSVFGYVPLTDTNDSNPFCVCCRGPLSGYVVHVFHDDSPQLKFRSVKGMFQAFFEAADASRDDYLDTHNLPSEVLQSPRTEHDRGTVSRLRSPEIEEEFRSDALRYACDLLADGQLEEITAVYDEGDEYLRDHVLKRLRKISDDGARQAVLKLEAEFDGFVEHCGEVLIGAGLSASVIDDYGRKGLRIGPRGPRGVGVNMPMFYNERRRADFDEYFLNWAKSRVGE